MSRGDGEKDTAAETATNKRWYGFVELEVAMRFRNGLSGSVYGQL
jgi:hypothetical protein